MTGRIEMFEIPSWSVDELIEIANKGFRRSLFEKLARGPRQRSDRIQRTLTDGTTADIYGVVMEALRHMKPGVNSIKYEDFRIYLREVIEDIPQMYEVSRVLEKIADISYNDGASTPVIDWDKDDAILTITDPFFAFYLRWSDDREQL